MAAASSKQSYLQQTSVQDTTLLAAWFMAYVHGSLWFFLSTNLLSVIVYYVVKVCLPIGRGQGGWGLLVVFKFVSEVLQLPSSTPSGDR
jgi:hypothetical protein